MTEELQTESPQNNTEGDKVINADASSQNEGKSDNSRQAVDNKQAAPQSETKYDLKLPEKNPLDDKAVNSIVEFAKQRGLTNDIAQSVLDRQIDAVNAFKQSQLEVVESTKAKWLEDVKSDKEIGGEALSKNVEMAKRVVERFGSEQFRKDLEATGFGNHPELIRVFSRIGRAMSDDTFVHPSFSGAGKRSMEEIFYNKK